MGSKKNETPEIFISHLYNSPGVKKLTLLLIIAGILVCLMALLPPVQKMVFSFVDTGTSGIYMKTSGTFDNRLMSLLSLPFFGLVVLIFAACCLFSEKIEKLINNRKNSKLILTILSGVIIFLLFYISVFSFKHGWQWLNSDHSSEMVLGKLLADENALVSTNWRYSTEIRLIYQTIFTMPLFKLLGYTNNWALIRALNILLNNLILILSYIFMAKQLKIKVKYIFLSSIFLILPVSIVYWDIVTFGGYYIFFLAQIFFCLGLFIRLVNNADSTNSNIIFFILFLIMSFVLGLQGIRSLLCVHIPLLITSIYFSIKTNTKKYFLFLGCFGFLISCAGFAGNYLLHFKYSFHSFDTMRLEHLFNRFFSKLGESLISLVDFFGLSTGNTLLSARGMFSIAAIIGTFLLFWTVIKSMRKSNAAQRTVNNHFIPVFFVISAVFNIFVFIIVDEKITDRYFIPFMVLYVPLIALFFQNIEKSYGHLKQIACLSGIILFLAGQSFLNFQTMEIINVNSTRMGYIEYLINNRLDYGFATSANSNVTTELTNGKVAMSGLESDGLEPGDKHFRMQGWLNPVKYYDPSWHEGESFLLLTREEWKMAISTGRDFANLQPDYVDNNFLIIRFPSAQIIHDKVLDNY